MSTGSINEQPILRRILLRLRDKIRNFFNRKSLSVTEEKLKTD